jgi:hypothetical protein
VLIKTQIPKIPSIVQYIELSKKVTQSANKEIAKKRKVKRLLEIEFNYCSLSSFSYCLDPM